MQHAVNHLAEVDNEKSCTPPPKRKVEDSKEEPSILVDFSAYMYEYEDETIFQEAFNITRIKASKQSWLDSIYKIKEKWAECYMTNVYILGMRSTQLSESLNSDLK
jgi:zinc finger SWIM domain-containing protein 3